MSQEKEHCPRCDSPLVLGHTFERCPMCGFNLEMWGGKKTASSKESVIFDEHRGGVATACSDILFHVSEKTDSVGFYCRALAYFLFFTWGWYFILLDMNTNAIGNSFMHNINLVFHEAGHMIFIPFGEFMTVLGGSLLQLLVPLGIMLGFLFHNQSRDVFSASIALWWFAQSLMDLAPYINDARALKLMLLGGGTGQDMPGMHDWKNILSDLGILEQDTKLAWIVDCTGELLMILAFVWGARILYLQYKFLRK